MSSFACRLVSLSLCFSIAHAVSRANAHNGCYEDSCQPANASGLLQRTNFVDKKVKVVTSVSQFVELVHKTKQAVCAKEQSAAREVCLGGVQFKDESCDCLQDEIAVWECHKDHLKNNAHGHDAVTYEITDPITGLKITHHCGIACIENTIVAIKDHAKANDCSSSSLSR